MTEHELVRQVAEEAPCDQEGCTELTLPCYLPDAVNEPSGYYCPPHAFDNGFCKMCGAFWGGIESFEFLQNGYCDECFQEMERNDEESDDDDFDGDYDPADDY